MALTRNDSVGREPNVASMPCRDGQVLWEAAGYNEN
mgnify:CR=1 FL=1